MDSILQWINIHGRHEAMMHQRLFGGESRSTLPSKSFSPSTTSTLISATNLSQTLHGQTIDPTLPRCVASFTIASVTNINGIRTTRFKCTRKREWNAMN